MANTDSFYTQLGHCIKSFYDSSGKRYETIQGGFLDNVKDLSEQVGLLRSIITLCMETDKYCTSLVKEYFIQYELSQVNFAKKKKVSFNTFHSQMQRAKDRLTRDFGADFILDLAGKKTAKGKALDLVRLNSYMFKYNKVAGLESQLYRLIDLDLSKKRASYNNKGVDEEDWDEWFAKLNMYTPKVRDVVSNTIPTEFIGYINYLLCSINRTEREEQQYQQLMELITVNQRYINNM